MKSDNYRQGEASEWRAIRRKVDQMLKQVKKLEIHQSVQVMLRELGVWMDEREDARKKLEPEVAREFSTMRESGEKPVFL